MGMDDIEILALCHRLLQLTNHSCTPAFILLAPEEREHPLVIANVATDRVPVLFSDWMNSMHTGSVQ